jgi:hypothetical protein
MAQLNFGVRLPNGILQRDVLGSRRPVKNEKEQQIDNGNQAKQTRKQVLLTLAPKGFHRVSFCGV